MNSSPNLTNPGISIPLTATSTANSRRATLLIWLVALALFAAGLGVRLHDITDEPLDFHPTRQLRGLIIARGIYYQLLPNADPGTRQDAIAYSNSVGQYEPSILEYLVARTYLLMDGEHDWVGRLYTSLFWLIGGLALFDLARRMLLDETDLSQGGRGASYAALGASALVVLGYYLMLPFAVEATRTIQPDPGMVMWIILCTYALYRWSKTLSWKWAILAGLLGGVAVLTKIVANYIVAGAAIAMVLSSLGIKRFWRSPQVYSMAVLMIAPATLYYMNRQGRASEYVESWTISLSHLLIEPSFYVRWLSMVESLMGLSVLALALIGVLIAHSRSRALLLGLWGGYAVYGLTLPYQMYTHSYYHLQLVPIIALSLLPVAQVILEKVFLQSWIWKALFGLVVAGVLVYVSWLSIYPQSRDDYRHEPQYWATIGSLLPTDGKILALTQDYGFRLMYYGWRKVTLWPTNGEQTLARLRGNEKDFENYFQKRIQDKSYFLITSFNQFNNQPTLKEELNKRFPVFAQGPGYLIYDLTQPLQ